MKLDINADTLPNDRPIETKNAIQANKEKNGTITQVTEFTEGPLPAPYILKGYDNAFPGAAKIIINEFQTNSEHVRKMREHALEAQIAKDKRGQWMAFIILVVILAIVIYSLYLGNITFAGVAGIAFLGMAAQSFLKQDKKEKDENKKQQK